VARPGSRSSCRIRSGPSDSARTGSAGVAAAPATSQPQDAPGKPRRRRPQTTDPAGPREIPWVACDQPEQGDEVDLDRQLTVGGPAGGSVRDLHPGISEEERRSRSSKLSPAGARSAPVASPTHENVAGLAAGRATRSGMDPAAASAVQLREPP
jgi:hypothetical protein